VVLRSGSHPGIAVQTFSKSMLSSRRFGATAPRGFWRRPQAPEMARAVGGRVGWFWKGILRPARALYTVRLPTNDLLPVVVISRVNRDCERGCTQVRFAGGGA
jgi:hypothetical protein